MSALYPKTVYLGDLAIGRARTWEEVSDLLRHDGHDYSGPELSRLGSESRDALFLPATVLQRRTYS